MRGQARSPERRRFLRRSAALGLALCLDAARAQQIDPREQRPTSGDRLVAADANHAPPKPLRVEDVLIDAKKPLVALPYDLASATVRDGAKLNRLLLLRLTEDTAPGAKGVVAFSAVCTHEACPVSEWIADEQRLLCPCHFSKFDVGAGGSVTDGPAPRGLPQLPLRLEANGELVVDGGFSAQPGVRRSSI